MSISFTRGFAALSLLGCMIVALGWTLTATSDALASGREAPPGELAELTVLAPSPNLPSGAQVQDQSTFAMGTMQWNVVFVEGDGSIQPQQESWTAAEIANIQNKIAVSEAHWEGLTAGFHPNARLNINVNYVNGGVPVTTGYEPSTDQSEVWINEVMGKIGPYTAPSRYTNVRNFNHAERVAANTNWATTIFVLDNTSAYLTSYAYAYYGGPFTILENDSAGWTPANFNMVLSHEMGHIFFALDEYYASGQRNTYTGGYLNTVNGNAERDAFGNYVVPPQPNALMLNNGNFFTGAPYPPSPWSSDMFGFRDTDADTIPDILDTFPTLTGSDAGSNPAAGLFDFSGSIAVNDITNQNILNFNFSNSGSDMTINTIASAFYELDGGAGVAFLPVDGIHDDYFESLAFSIAGLSAGLHSIDVYGFNSVGNRSNLLQFTINVTGAAIIPEPSAVLVWSLLAALGIVCGWRRKR